MGKVKKILATLIVMTLVVSSITVGAATKSPAKKEITDSAVTVTANKMVYNKGPQDPVTVKVVVDGKTLTEGTDYIVAAPKVTNPGTYKVTVKVTGIGHFEGTVTKQITVVVEETKTKLTNPSVTVTPKKMTYNKKNQIPVNVKVVVNGKTLKEGTDYTVVVAKVKNAGKYIVYTQVIGIGQYDGKITKKVTATVKKAKQKLKKTKKRKVKYKKVKKKTVKIKLKVKSTGKGKIKYKRVSKKLKVSKKGKVTIKKGTKKGTYKVKVKAKATKNYKATKWKKIKIRIK